MDSDGDDSDDSDYVPDGVETYTLNSEGNDSVGAETDILTVKAMIVTMKISTTMKTNLNLAIILHYSRELLTPH